MMVVQHSKILMTWMTTLPQRFFGSTLRAVEYLQIICRVISVFHALTNEERTTHCYHKATAQLLQLAVAGAEIFKRGCANTF